MGAELLFQVNSEEMINAYSHVIRWAQVDRKLFAVADTVQTVWHRHRKRDLQLWRFALRVCTWIFEFVLLS